MNHGALIICGGKSTRMGTSKAMLRFGDQRMLQRVVRLIGEVIPTENIVVAAAAGQPLPELPRPVCVVRDRTAGRGPLEGLAVGLAALADRAEAAYVSGCDAPLLKPAWIREMFRRLGDADICVPKDREFHHPLAAVYRTRIVPAVESLLDADRLRPLFLFDQCATTEVPVDELRPIDSELQSLMNLNRPEEYQAALRAAGLPDDSWQSDSGGVE